MWPNTKRAYIRSKSRESEVNPDILISAREEHDNLNPKINNLTINLREMTFIDQNVLANLKARPNKVCKGKQSFQNLSHRFSHLDHLNHENIKLKNQVDELKKKVEEQNEEITKLRKFQEENLEAKLPTQCFTQDDSKALKFLIGKFKENFDKIKKSTQVLPKMKEPLQGYSNLIQVLDRWSKEVIKADLNTKATTQSMSTEEDQLLSSARVKDTVDFENIPIEKIKFTGNLGVGSSSSVHKAMYEGEEVAVKKIFRGGEQGKELEKLFWKETSIMKKIRHPKIVLFMGVARTDDYYYIMTEYMSKRSLDLVLKDQTILLDTRTRLRIAIDIAKGLNFLHSLNPPVLHRDLKTANVLCNDHLEGKLADFGLAKLRDQNFSTNTIATVRYMAPEFIAKQVFGIKSDIFSFGMILWEIFSRKEPFEELNPTQALYAIAVGRRPEMPKDMPEELKDVVIGCWDQDPNMRPECSQILQRLNEIKELLN